MKKELLLYIFLIMGFGVDTVGFAQTPPPPPQKLLFSVRVEVANGCPFDICYGQVEATFRGSIIYNNDSCKGCQEHCFPKNKISILTITPAAYDDMAQIATSSPDGNFSFIFLTGYPRSYCERIYQDPNYPINTCVLPTNSSQCKISSTAPLSWQGDRNITFQIRLDKP